MWGGRSSCPSDGNIGNRTTRAAPARRRRRLVPAGPRFTLSRFRGACRFIFNVFWNCGRRRRAGMMQFTGLFVLFGVFFCLFFFNCRLAVHVQCTVNRCSEGSGHRHGGAGAEELAGGVGDNERWSGRTAWSALTSSGRNMEPQTPFHLAMDTVRRSIDLYT